MLKTFSILVAAVAANAQHMPLAEPVPEPEVIAFRSDPVLRLTVPVTVNGRPQRFLVDTGAERSGISRELANDLGLEQSGPLWVTSFAGTSLVPTVTVPSMQFAKATRTDVRTLAFSKYAIGADGYLGIDVLKGATVSFDFLKNQIRIRRTRAGLLDLRTHQQADLRTKNGRLVFTDVSANNIKLQAILDTGSGLSVGNAQLRDALAAKGRLGPTVPTRILTVTGEIIPVDYAVVRELVIGDVYIRNLPVAFSVGAPFERLGFEDRPAMLLGMDALRVFKKVSIDFRSNRVRFNGDDHFGSTSFWFG